MATKEHELITMILEGICRKSTYRLLSEVVEARNGSLPDVLCRLGLEPGPVHESYEPWFESLTPVELFRTAWRVLEEVAPEGSPAGQALSPDHQADLYRLHGADFAQPTPSQDAGPEDAELKDWMELEKLVFLALVKRCRHLVEVEGKSVEELRPVLMPVYKLLQQRVSFFESLESFLEAETKLS